MQGVGPNGDTALLQSDSIGGPLGGSDIGVAAGPVGPANVGPIISATKNFIKVAKHLISSYRSRHTHTLHSSRFATRGIIKTLPN